MLRDQAWCEETVMKDRVENEWSDFFTKPIHFIFTGKILVVDVHRARHTNAVKQLLLKRKTVLKKMFHLNTQVVFSHWKWSLSLFPYRRKTSPTNASYLKTDVCDDQETV